MNVKSSSKRLRALMRHAKTMDSPFDIICVQDPPKSLPFCGRGSYYVWYNAGRELTEADNTSYDTPMKGRVAFYVDQSLRPVDWRVNYCNTSNIHLVATLRLTTTMGDIFIHNVYNCLKQLDIQQFIRTCTGEGAHIIFGDFNEHHPVWTADTTSEPGNSARELWSGLEAAKMKLLIKPGVITYSRSSDPNSPSSTIDLVFGSPAITTLDPQWQIVDVDAFDSDHRLSQTILSLEPFRESWSRPSWKKANKQRVLAATKYHLSFLDSTSPLDTRPKIRQYALNLARALKAVATDVLPPSKPRKPKANSKKQPSFQTALEKARLSFGISPTTSIPDDDMTAQLVLLKAEHIQALESRTSWREYILTRSRDDQGIYSLFRLARKLATPSKSPQLDRLVVNEIEYKNTFEIGELIKQEWWSDHHGQDPLPIPEPRLDGEPEQHPCPKVLKNGEVRRLISRLKFGKAAGLDTLPNDLFKIIKDIITPYLERLFSACLEHSYMPDHFKEARTLVLRKVDKKSYLDPGSFRPIDLLSVMGKMLESLVAHRLRDFSIQHNLLPSAQYGVAGKSTTQALRMIIDPIYGAWIQKSQATLMRLDMKGAYPGVDREKLLDILTVKGIPKWIIRFVCSFLATLGIFSDGAEDI